MQVIERRPDVAGQRKLTLMIKYLFTKNNRGKIGVTAHLSNDGKAPVCEAAPRAGCSFVLEDKPAKYVCGDCFRITVDDSPEHSGGIEVSFPFKFDWMNE